MVTIDPAARLVSETRVTEIVLLAPERGVLCPMALVVKEAALALAILLTNPSKKSNLPCLRNLIRFVDDKWSCKMSIASNSAHMMVKRSIDCMVTKLGTRPVLYRKSFNSLVCKITAGDGMEPTRNPVLVLSPTDRNVKRTL